MEDPGSGGGLMQIVFLLVMLVLMVFFAYCMGRVGSKLGESFWLYAVGMFVPILNIYLLVKLAAIDWWWILLCFVPLVNIVAVGQIYGKIGERLGKGFWASALVGAILTPIWLLWMAFSE